MILQTRSLVVSKSGNLLTEGHEINLQNHFYTIKKIGKNNLLQPKRPTEEESVQKMILAPA